MSARSTWMWWATVVGLLALLIVWRWVGYQAADDASYYRASLEWITAFPPLGASHWDLRYTIVLPLALALYIFGESELTLGLFGLCYFAAAIVPTCFFLSRRYRAAAGLSFLAIVCTMPGFLANATHVTADVPELAFVAASFLAYLCARERNGETMSLVLTGGFASLAFLTRETSAALVIFYGILFLFAPGMPRPRYFLVAAAFVALIGAQAAYFSMVAGDPFYRTSLSARHDKIDRAAQVQDVSKSDNVLDSQGNLSINVALDPFLVLFVSQKYGLLFYFGLPALLILYKLRRKWNDHRELPWLFAGLGLTWFVFVALNFSILFLVPRYFIITAYCFSAILAMFVARCFQTHKLAITWFGAIFFASNFVLLYLENTAPAYAEQAVVRLARMSDEPIHTDPRTVARASPLFTFAGVENRLTSEPPTLGSLVVLSPDNIKRCRSSPVCRTRLAAVEAKSSWHEIGRDSGRARILGIILRSLNLDRFIPQQIMRKIEQPNAGIIWYRVA